jgi:hypothetical protein
MPGRADARLLSWRDSVSQKDLGWSFAASDPCHPIALQLHVAPTFDRGLSPSPSSCRSVATVSAASSCFSASLQDRARGFVGGGRGAGNVSQPACAASKALLSVASALLAGSRRRRTPVVACSPPGIVLDELQEAAVAAQQLHVLGVPAVIGAARWVLAQRRWWGNAGAAAERQRTARRLQHPCAAGRPASPGTRLSSTSL